MPTMQGSAQHAMPLWQDKAAGSLLRPLPGLPLNTQICLLYWWRVAQHAKLLCSGSGRLFLGRNGFQQAARDERSQSELCWCRARSA